MSRVLRTRPGTPSELPRHDPRPGVLRGPTDVTPTLPTPGRQPRDPSTLLRRGLRLSSRPTGSSRTGDEEGVTRRRGSDRVPNVSGDSLVSAQEDTVPVWSGPGDPSSEDGSTVSSVVHRGSRRETNRSRPSERWSTAGYGLWSRRRRVGSSPVSSRRRRGRVTEDLVRRGRPTTAPHHSLRGTVECLCSRPTLNLLFHFPLSIAL